MPVGHRLWRLLKAYPRWSVGTYFRTSRILSPINLPDLKQSSYINPAYMTDMTRAKKNNAQPVTSAIKQPASPPKSGYSTSIKHPFFVDL